MNQNNITPCTFTLSFSLSGLSCMKCVKKVNDALSNMPQLLKADIDKTNATIQFRYIDTASSDQKQQIQRLQANQFIALIQSIGYKAILNEPTFSPQKIDTEKLEPAKTIPENNIHTGPTSQTEIPINKPKILANETLQLKIAGMTCASCVKHVEDTLLALPNVARVDVNLARGSAIVRGSQLYLSSLIQASTDAGYPAIKMPTSHSDREMLRDTEHLASIQLKLKTVIALLLGTLLMIWGLIGDMHVTASNQGKWIIIGIMTLIVMTGTGYHFFLNAWLQLKQRRSNMDTLVSLGAGSAWLYSFVINLFPNLVPEGHSYLYYESSVMIIGLINLGKYLEHRAKCASSEALEQLLDLTPQHVLRVTDIKTNARVAAIDSTFNISNKQQIDELVPIDQLMPGDWIRLRVGERIAVDGKILSGQLALNESMLTGEANLVQKSENHEVYAGTLVEQGTAIIQANAIGEDTQLAHIIKRVELAQSSKPKLAKLADRISAIFVPIILLIALLTALSWSLLTTESNLNYAFITTVSVLIIACPCALGLAIPMSIITSVGRAAKLGILVRDASVLERASEIDTLVFDKTGTLTEGKPRLIETLLFPTRTSWNKTTLIKLAAQLEEGSTHPIANAFLTANSEMEADTIYQTNKEFYVDFHTWIGEGLSGKMGSQQIVLGNRTLLARFKIDTSLLDLNDENNLTSQLKQAQNSGATLVYIAIDTELVAAFIIEDTLREDVTVLVELLAGTYAPEKTSKHVISSAQKSSSIKRQYEVILLSGDNHATANAIADKVNIKNVIADVKPLDKAEHIKALQAQGKRVAMIGDGINDAPALAQADLSIAMGAGSDIAKESADFILLNNQLLKLPVVFGLAKRVQINMQQNLFFAFIYNIIAIPIAAGVFYPISGLLLNPMIAATAMALSSVTVVMNANRLLK